MQSILQMQRSPLFFQDGRSAKSATSDSGGIGTGFLVECAP